MAKKKLSARTVQAWIKEEKKAARMYAKWNFDLIARDERQHAIWLKNVLANIRGGKEYREL